MLQNRIAVNLAFFINGFVYASWVSRLPRIQEIFQASDSTIGIILLSSSIGAVGAMPFAGWFIIKNGSRNITLVSAVLYCVYVPLIPLIPTLAILIALYFIMGITTGLLDVAMNAQAVKVEQQYNKPIMTSFHAYFSIGMALGAWFGAVFADFGFDLIHHFITIACLSLVATAWMSFHLINDRVEKSLQHEGPLFRLPNATLITIGIIAFCCMLGEGSMADWSVNYMENISHAGQSLAPIGLSAFATAMTLGRIFGDKARAKFGDKKMIITGSIVATAGLSLALLFPTPYIAISGFFFVGAGLSTIVPITYSIAGNTKGLPPGVGLAMVTTVGYAGFLMGPPVIGFISDWQNLRIGLLTVALLLCVMTVLGILFKSESFKE